MKYVINKEEYQALKQAWKQKKDHSSHEILAYNILRGFDAKRGFTPITNKRKLENGFSEWEAFESASRVLRNKLSQRKRYSWETEEKYSESCEKEKTEFKEKFGLERTEELCGKMLECLQNV